MVNTENSSINEKSYDPHTLAQLIFLVNESIHLIYAKRFRGGELQKVAEAMDLVMSDLTQPPHINKEFVESLINESREKFLSALVGWRCVECAYNGDRVSDVCLNCIKLATTVSAEFGNVAKLATDLAFFIDVSLKMMENQIPLSLTESGTTVYNPVTES